MILFELIAMNRMILTRLIFFLLLSFTSTNSYTDSRTEPDSTEEAIRQHTDSSSHNGSENTGANSAINDGIHGMIYTEAEPKAWNERRLNGIFKAHWNKIYNRANLFKVGAIDRTIWVNPGSNPYRVDEGNFPPRKLYAGLRDAAFVYRMYKYAGEPDTDAYLQ